MAELRARRGESESEKERAGESLRERATREFLARVSPMIFRGGLSGGVPLISL